MTDARSNCGATIAPSGSESLSGERAPSAGLRCSHGVKLSDQVGCATGSLLRAGLPATADGVSPAWPLDDDSFEPCYANAERLYQVHGNRGEAPTEPKASAPERARARCSW
jgi:hypothetical protein